MTPAQRQSIRAGFERGDTYQAIADELGLSYSTVHDEVKRLGLKRPKKKSRSPWHKKFLYGPRGVT